MKYGKSVKKTVIRRNQRSIAPLVGTVLGLGALGALGVGGYKYFSGSKKNENVIGNSASYHGLEEEDEEPVKIITKPISSVDTGLREELNESQQEEEIKLTHEDQLKVDALIDVRDAKKLYDSLFDELRTVTYLYKDTPDVKNKLKRRFYLEHFQGIILEKLEYIEPTNHMKLLKSLQSIKEEKANIVPENIPLQTEVKSLGNREIMQNRFRQKEELNREIEIIKSRILETENFLKLRESGNEERALLIEYINRQQKLLLELEKKRYFGSKRKRSRRSKKVKKYLKKTSRKKSRKVNKRRRSRK
jgi:hypothetical protein